MDGITIKIPKGERLWVTYEDDDKTPRYVVTTKGFLRDYYYLYSVDADGSVKKLGKDKSPIELENKYLKEWFDK